jgi:hypothetical protein
MCSLRPSHATRKEPRVGGNAVNGNRSRQVGGKQRISRLSFTGISAPWRSGGGPFTIQATSIMAAHRLIHAPGVGIFQVASSHPPRVAAAAVPPEFFLRPLLRLPRATGRAKVSASASPSSGEACPRFCTSALDSSTPHCVGKYTLNRPHSYPSPVSGDGTWGIVARRKIGKFDVSGKKTPISRYRAGTDEQSRPGVFCPPPPQNQKVREARNGHPSSVRVGADG